MRDLCIMLCQVLSYNVISFLYTPIGRGRTHCRRPVFLSQSAILVHWLSEVLEI